MTSVDSRHTIYPTLFVSQNIWLKTVILLTGSVTVIAVAARVLPYIFALTTLYLTLYPPVWKDVWKGVRKLLSFFAAYALFATLLHVDFITMLVFMFRLLLLIMLMVYFSSSLTLHRLMEDCHVLRKHTLFYDLNYFLVATILFIHQFIHFYKADSSLKKQFFNYDKVLARLLDGISYNWSQRDHIDLRTHELLSQQYVTPAFLNKANVLACAYITFLILCLSV